ncbi:MAG: DNA alkylation repair protein [Salinivirgaceae bacterium]|nr:DNA alkylation repair protein [Salinivirgaceae bacterium]
MSTIIKEIKLEALASSETDRIVLYKKFFKCIPGGYGEGDVFAGIRNPILRNLAKKYKTIAIDDVFTLLKDEIHEIRLLALFILELKVKNKKITTIDFDSIAKGYIDNLDYVNNWDLVDASAHHILGFWEFENNSGILLKLSKESGLWKNRVAMIGTFYHIRKNEFELTLKIAEILINHKHDIIHKAVGWMLREIGNRNREVELEFLNHYYKTMPRTMLRYAIEKFEEPLRLSYLKGLI